MADAIHQKPAEPSAQTNALVTLASAATSVGHAISKVAETWSRVPVARGRTALQIHIVVATTARIRNAPQRNGAGATTRTRTTV